MKLVTFTVETPIGRVDRLGALLDGDQNGRNPRRARSPLCVRRRT
jgi:hypothetical protein